MILVDTNVLIAVLRTNDAKLVNLLNSHGAAACGVVHAELLCGARTPRERSLIIAMLSTLATVPIAEALWEQVGDNLARMRSRGVTVPFPDAVLATLAVSLNIELWTRDQHFALVQQAIPALRLFQEPP